VLILFAVLVIGLLSFKNAFSESITEFVNDKMKNETTKKKDYYKIVKYYIILGL
jgi:hypothetical protein